jgi:stage II sporulation protein M
MESMLFLSREERRAYAAQLRPYVSASVVLFLIGIAAGVVIVRQMPELADRFIENLAAFVKHFSGMPRWRLAIAIFLNNSVKTLIAILSGSLLGIVPAVFLLANGAALGVAFSVSIQTRGVWSSLASVVPHGVIELPAVFLGTSIGLYLGGHALKKLRKGSETAMRGEILRALRFFCAVILPLLLLAALMEAFVTAALVGTR